jgi:hypothetical protein
VGQARLLEQLAMRGGVEVLALVVAVGPRADEAAGQGPPTLERVLVASDE